MHDNIKALLGITDDSQDDKLTAIVDSVKARLLVLLGGADTVPAALAYIVDEVAIIRFNRIGSEGMSSHSVEGESITFGDNDFGGFMGDIDAWMSEQQETKIGRVRFL